MLELAVVVLVRSVSSPLVVRHFFISPATLRDMMLPTRALFLTSATSAAPPRRATTSIKDQLQTIQSFRPRVQPDPTRPVKSSKKRSPYSITERRVPALIPVLGSQPAGDVSHKPGGRLPLLSVRPAVTPATLKRAATNFAAW